MSDVKPIGTNESVTRRTLRVGVSPQKIIGTSAVGVTSLGLRKEIETA